MRYEGNSLDEKDSTNCKKVEFRYKLVANIMKNMTNFTTIEDLAKMANMDEKKLTHCIHRVKRELAKEKIIVVNRLGHGYKIGNFIEFVDEVDKAFKRAKAQISSIAKLTRILKESGINEDFSFIEEVVRKNLNSIEVLFEQPEADEFEEYEEFKEAADEFYNSNMIFPDSLKSIPNELVDSENPDGLTD